MCSLDCNVLLICSPPSSALNGECRKRRSDVNTSPERQTCQMVCCGMVEPSSRGSPRAPDASNAARSVQSPPRRERASESISVQDIAERSTVNRATFYDHFTDKFALLEDMIGEEFRAAFLRRMEGVTGTCPAAIRQLILTVCDFLGELCLPTARSTSASSPPSWNPRSNASFATTSSKALKYPPNAKIAPWVPTWKSAPPWRAGPSAAPASIGATRKNSPTKNSLTSSSPVSSRP